MTGFIQPVIGRNIGSAVTCGALLHANGGNGSTTITDDKGHTCSAAGAATISTAQSKFGGSSFGNNAAITDYIQINSDSAIQFGSGDFTVEFWLWATGLGVANQQGLISNRDGVGTTDAFVVYITNADKIGMTDETGTFSIAGSAVLTASTWTHIAVARSGTTLKVFINGAVDTTTTVSNNFSATTNYQIGNGNSANFWNRGFMDEVMLIKGTARYTGAFTVPNAPYMAL